LNVGLYSKVSERIDNYRFARKSKQKKLWQGIYIDADYIIKTYTIKNKKPWTPWTPLKNDKK